MRRATSPEALGFKTTAELKPNPGLPGQEQALAAISAGARMKSKSHNVVVVGATGPAAIGQVCAEIQSIAATRAPPSDWVYVANFEDRHAPRALQLPAGHGRVLASMMDEAINEIRSAIITTLAGDTYQTRWRAIDAEFQARHQSALEALARTADAHNIALLRTPMGYAMAPAHDGGVVSPEIFNAMPPSMQADVRAQITALEANLSELLESAPQIDRQRRARLSKLNREVISGIVRAALDEPRREFAGLENVAGFLADVEADAVAAANILLPTIDIPDILGAERFASVDEARLDTYRVNPFVAWPQETEAAPVVQELAPDDASLFGTATTPDAAAAHHMHLTAGLLHRADGGFLLLDARALTASLQTWSALLTAIGAGALRPGGPNGGLPASGPIPQAIPLDVKIILLTDADHVRRLSADDPRFRELFGIEATFADRIPRSPENEGALARVIARIAEDEALGPLDTAAVAGLIELAARKADNRDELLLDLDELTATARLADDLRAAASRKSISRDDIIIAQAARRQHAAAAFDVDLNSQPTVGVIVGLVEQPAQNAAEQACSSIRRVTARIRQASLKPGEVEISRIDSAAADTPAECTIAAYLAAEFGQAGPIAISAGLEGALHAPKSEQRATCAELIALLSAIAGLPLPQTIAVAGTIDQFGKLWSEGRVNDAVEEFFDACQANAITSEAGIVIPAACQSRLMLRQDIVDAVAAGKFAVWGAETVAECFAILTRLPAGTRGGDGCFAEGDAYRLVNDALNKLHQRAARPLSSGEALQ